MPDFSKRSLKKELLDDPAIPFKDIKKNMEELNTVNRLLGGHSITLKGFKELLGNNKTVSVCEVGCGGGDNLLVIDDWCRRNSVKADLTGIDINLNCIEFAREKTASHNINFICSDYKDVYFSQRPAIIFSSLFCHHFADDNIVDMLKWMHVNATTGFFINDLHRHPVAYFSIKHITKIFSGSYLVKNDAPLSVLRGFTKKEWQSLMQQAGLKYLQISWEWAFRHLVISLPQTGFATD